MKGEIMRAVWNVSGPQGKECECGRVGPKEGAFARKGLG